MDILWDIGDNIFESIPIRGKGYPTCSTNEIITLLDFRAVDRSRFALTLILSFIYVQVGILILNPAVDLPKRPPPTLSPVHQTISQPFSMDVTRVMKKGSRLRQKVTISSKWILRGSSKNSYLKTNLCLMVIGKCAFQTNISRICWRQHLNKGRRRAWSMKRL